MERGDPGSPRRAIETSLTADDQAETVESGLEERGHLLRSFEEPECSGEIINGRHPTKRGAAPPQNSVSRSSTGLPPTSLTRPSDSLATPSTRPCPTKDLMSPPATAAGRSRPWPRTATSRSRPSSIPRRPRSSRTGWVPAGDPWVHRFLDAQSDQQAGPSSAGVATPLAHMAFQHILLEHLDTATSAFALVPSVVPAVPAALTTPFYDAAVSGTKPDTAPHGLQEKLTNLIDSTRKYKNVGRNLAVSLVDLSGANKFSPKYAGINDLTNFYGASVNKITGLLGVCQLLAEANELLKVQPTISILPAWRVLSRLSGPPAESRRSTILWWPRF